MLTEGYGWKETDVLQSIIRVAEVWGTRRREFQAAFEEHRRSFDSIPQEYDDAREDETRLNSLVSLYRLVVGFHTVEWWDMIRNRINMVLFYDRFSREVDLRRLRYPSRVLG